ncbi:PEP-CTERM sorting domain-containing protein [Motiliproteus sediminis]|uniref:PEP-CTERM sorting domain-containing protein n=1 Tax=Motiliproteus sediminis TaxID=1468178 RepID=UPI001AF01227|nr:PEP-CTERM sorting domain-containing protein [Motiliproteus sediminis]
MNTLARLKRCASLIACTTALPLMITAAPSHAVAVFDQGFETDTAGMIGNFNRTASGTDGLTSFEGGFHAVATGGYDDNNDYQYAYTRFDGYRDSFPGDYSASVAIFLDTSWAAGSGFDYSVASNGTDGNHQRDFIFHVTQDSSSGQLLVGGNNNSNFAPIENLEAGNHFVVENSGWYLFEHLFRNDGGLLAVDLNLYSSVGDLLFTETRTSAADTIPGDVGGNRYGWFTDISVEGGLAVDAFSLNLPAPVPEPASLALVGLALLAASRFRKH